MRRDEQYNTLLLFSEQYMKILPFSSPTNKKEFRKKYKGIKLLIWLTIKTLGGGNNSTNDYVRLKWRLINTYLVKT